MPSQATQTDVPMASSSADSVPNISVPSSANLTEHPQLTQDVAFGARIVEAGPEEPDTEDSFVSSDSVPAPVETPAKPDPHAENQRREAPRQDRIPAAPAPQPEPANTPKSAEAINPISTGSGNANAAPARSPATESAAQTPAPRAADIPLTEQRTTQPVHDVTLRLTSDTQQVDVKLSDRGGELRVAVQSADPILTTDLRASVHDLIGGLEKGGFHTDVWQPGSSPRHDFDATAGVSRGAGDQPQSQNGEDPRRQGRNPYDPDYAPSRRNRGSDTEWIKEMSALTGAEKEN